MTYTKGDAISFLEIYRHLLAGKVAQGITRVEYGPGGIRERDAVTVVVLSAEDVRELLRGVTGLLEYINSEKG